MKANKAPEKIYVHIKDKPCEITFSEVIEKECSNIEYTRTDAFIERAAEWLDNFYNEDTNSYLIDEDIESFIDYMKGE